MDTKQRDLREAVRSTLSLFRSSEAAIQFQSSVSHVFAPTEMLAKWFDNTYILSPAFVDAFTEVEHDAMRQFNSILEQLAMQAGEPPPPIERFVALPAWNTVAAKANDALRTIAA